MLKRQPRNDTGRVGEIGFEVLAFDLGTTEAARGFLRDALFVDAADLPPRFLGFVVAVQRVFVWGVDDVLLMVAHAAAARPLKASLAAFNRVGFTAYAEAMRMQDPCFLVRTCEQEEAFLGLLSDEDLELYAQACAREPERGERERQFNEAEALDNPPTNDEVIIRVPETEG